MNLLKPAISGIFKLRQSAIENFVHNPDSVQKQVFNEIIHGGQFTQFGKKYEFEKINSIADYKQNIPISDYDTLKPYVDQMLAGKQNVIWHSPITWFAKSSGTTSDKSKFIPVSKETLDENHFKAGKDTLTLYLMNNPQTGIFAGKCLVIGGSHQINQMHGTSYYGDLSAVVLQNMPFVGQIMRAPELSIALMDEWESKIEKIVDATLEENITYIAGVPTWTLILLKRALEKSGKKYVKDIWPNLELYIHGGVSFLPYREQFQEIIGNPNMKYMETYNASEGFFAAQDDLDTPGMLLLLNHGIFYEFLPMEEWGKENPQTIGLSEVQKDVNYALVISTNSGLYRYLVGDTVRFTSTDPYRVVVSGRVKHYINAFGEEVIVDNSDQAIANASKKTGAKVLEYTAAPMFLGEGGVGYHEWIIEFDELPVSLSEFATVLDSELQQINSDYEAKRYKNIALQPLRIHQMQNDGFNDWLKSKNKLGGQHKVPRLSNERKYIEEILPFIK